MGSPLRVLPNRPARVIEPRPGPGRFGYDFPQPVHVVGVDLQPEEYGHTLLLLQPDGGVTSLWLPLMGLPNGD